MREVISACGLNCLTCECYEATQANDEERKKIVAKKWSKQYEAELTADDINCDGCMSEGNHFGWVLRCPIRACTVGRGLGSCAECVDFPCPTGEFLWTNVPEARETIEQMRIS